MINIDIGSIVFGQKLHDVPFTYNLKHDGPSTIKSTNKDGYIAAVELTADEKWSTLFHILNISICETEPRYDISHEEIDTNLYLVYKNTNHDWLEFKKR